MRPEFLCQTDWITVCLPVRNNAFSIQGALYHPHSLTSISSNMRYTAAPSTPLAFVRSVLKFFCRIFALGASGSKLMFDMYLDCRFCFRAAHKAQDPTTTPGQTVLHLSCIFVVERAELRAAPSGSCV